MHLRHNPLGLKQKQRQAVFGSLLRRHLANRSWSQNTIVNNKEKLSLMVEAFLWNRIFSFCGEHTTVQSSG